MEYYYCSDAYHVGIGTPWPKPIYNLGHYQISQFPTLEVAIARKAIFRVLIASACIVQRRLQNDFECKL